MTVVAGDIGVAAVDGELVLVTRTSTVDKGTRISSVEEFMAGICMMEVVIIVTELTSVMLGDTVSSGMSIISLISLSPDPDPTKLVTV